MRVLITRPRQQAERTAARLLDQGHQPLVAPLLTIMPTGEPRPPGRFDAVVVTSANAAPLLAPLRDDHAQVPIFAVGEGTAARLRDAGWGDVRVGSGDGEAVARLMLQSIEAGRRVLHVTGRDRKAEPAATLARRFEFVGWAAYDAVAASTLPIEIAQALQNGALDAALHYSPRSAELALALARKATLTQPLLALRHCCLSEEVAQPLSAAGASRLSVAVRPDEASLFAALREGFSPERFG